MGSRFPWCLGGAKGVGELEVVILSDFLLQIGILCISNGCIFVENVRTPYPKFKLAPWIHFAI